MSVGSYIVIAALFGVSVAAQLWYLRTYRDQITAKTRVIMWVNIGLLTGVAVLVGVVVFSAGGS